MCGQNIALHMTSVDWDRVVTPAGMANIAKGWWNENVNGGSHGWMDMINEIKDSDFDES